MHCSKCGSENPSEKKYCSECGAELARRCAQCGARNAPGAKFCGECGVSLSPSTSSPRSATQADETRAAGERRHLTILFCDLVGSTTLAAQLDPEEWRATVAAYQRAAAEAIRRFGGEVVRYVGDGIMAFFGYPAAHDNDAERAARAGLAIVDAIAQLNQQPGHTELSVRIGVDSGRVVVGAGAGEAVDAFGDTANIAARVQAVAEPGTVVVTGETHRLISGLFVVEDRGPHPLKGIAREVKLYRVVRSSGMRGRLAAAATTRPLTPFVGREDELRLLMSRWERAVEGEGQVGTIVGEAGIGKSRLVQEFRDRIAADRHTWLECATAAFFQNTPFYAVVDMLQQTFHWHSNQNNERRLAALEASLAATGIDIDEGVPLIAALLGLPLGDKYPPLRMPPEQQRRRLLATLVAWTIGFAKAQPLVLATEDLHWADPSTLEVTQLLVEQGATAPLLLLYTARPEFRAQWSSRAHHTQITLNRLSARHVRTIVGEVAAQKALSDETVAAVVERTGGVPLFVEELTRAVLESGDAKLTGREIPATLHDSLMARLDRLGAAKEVLQVGAVIGSDFSYDLLHAVHPTAEAELQAALRKLADAELLYVRGIAPEATYQLKHALIRDAAYEALLKSRRKELHRIVARAIDEQFPGLKETQPEVLARHWTEAGEAEPAITQWQQAGKTAQARNAFREALENYQQAVALVNLLPQLAERDVRELELKYSVYSLLFITRGPTAAETIDSSERVAALAEKSGNVARLEEAARSRCITAYFSGDLRTAVMLADQALELASRARRPAGLASAHMMQILTRLQLGDLAGAEKHFAAGLTFFDDPGFKHGAGGGVLVAFGVASSSAWLVGRADVARQRIAQMMTAVNRSNPFDVALSEFLAASHHLRMGEYEQAEALAARGIALSEKQFGDFITESSRCILGHALGELGRAVEGVELVRQGIARLLETGSPLEISRWRGGLAIAQDRAGAIVDALATIEQALQGNPDQLVMRPEILRVRGELRLKMGQTELAEADFRDSIALAQKMGAKAWELRSTMSLARLLARQDQRGEARTMLAEIYNWFTEGFETVDLKDAKALLDELSA